MIEEVEASDDVEAIGWFERHLLFKSSFLRATLDLVAMSVGDSRYGGLDLPCPTHAAVDSATLDLAVRFNSRRKDQVCEYFVKHRRGL